MRTRIVLIVMLLSLGWFRPKIIHACEFVPNPPTPFPLKNRATIADQIAVVVPKYTRDNYPDIYAAPFTVETWLKGEGPAQIQVGVFDEDACFEDLPWERAILLLQATEQPHVFELLTHQPAVLPYSESVAQSITDRVKQVPYVPTPTAPVVQADAPPLLPLIAVAAVAVGLLLAIVALRRRD